MSKTSVKKCLLAMEKKDIIDVVLDMYDSSKEAKEFLEFLVCPNEIGKLEEYKAIIKAEFYPKKQREPKMRFSVCRKAVADFKKFKPSADALAELMVSYMEWATELTFDYGDMSEQYYDSVEGNFGKTVKYLVANGLWDKYDARLRQCVKWSDGNGYGFADAIAGMYEESKAIAEKFVAEYFETEIGESEKDVR